MCTAVCILRAALRCSDNKENDVRLSLFNSVQILELFVESAVVAPAVALLLDSKAAVACVIVIIGHTVEVSAVLSLRTYHVYLGVALLLEVVVEVLSVAARMTVAECDRVADRHDLYRVILACGAGARSAG